MIKKLIYVQNFIGDIMVEALLSLVACATIVVGGHMEHKDIGAYINNYDKVVVIIDNNYYGDIKDEDLKNILNQMLQDSHPMPALGISLHTETLESLKSGIWLKLQYNGTQYVDDMPFDELLINVNSEFFGFNIIRGNKGVYDGRCYYIDLVDNTMSPLYEHLIANYR